MQNGITARKTSKSKSFSVNDGIKKDKLKPNKSVEYTKPYKSAKENARLGADVIIEHVPEVSDPGRKLKKNKNLQLIGKLGNNPLYHGVTKTSTPISEAKTFKYSTESNIKPIIKKESANDTLSESPNTSSRKKRNKSVSFMLGEGESPIKKSKIDPKTTENNDTPKQKKSKNKNKNKLNKLEDELSEKENISQINVSKLNKPKKIKNKGAITDNNSMSVDDSSGKDKKTEKKLKNNEKKVNDGNALEVSVTDSTVTLSFENKPKKKRNKRNKSKGLSNPAETVPEVPSVNGLEKKKKKKAKAKKTISAEENGSESQPEISEDLKNLNIGDSPHTLTNLLDEMTVTDKSKKPKNKNPKPKLGKMKRKKTNSTSSLESLTLEKLDGGEKKEKVKWQKRKWNKEGKGPGDGLVSTVIVENLPLKMILNYKKELSEHFKSCGQIKGIGIAEVYPTEDPKPVFTTSIHFIDESAAAKALDEDNTLLDGHRIRVKKPLPATDTTMVVKSYGNLSEQAVSSAFSGAGKIRSIRQVVKGGSNKIGTAFLEFDGPKSVENALKMAADAKIGGKKVYASKYEIRDAKKRKMETPKLNKQDRSDDDSDSD